MRIGIRETFLLALLLALPLLSWWLVFRPQNAFISQAKREIDHKHLMLDKLKETTSRTRTWPGRTRRSRRTSSRSSRLPSNKEVDAVIRQVSDLAVESGLEPPNIESDKPVAAALYMEQPLKMKITGNSTASMSFW